MFRLTSAFLLRTCSTIFFAVQAVGGFAGPGELDLDSGMYFFERMLITEEDDGTLQFSGTFKRDDEATLPASAAVFTYLVGDDAETFVQAQGDIDYSTGEFSVTITDIPVGSSKLILIFAVLDPADTLDEQGANTAYSMDVVNSGCSNPLTITLEWSTDNSDFDLYITEPSGSWIHPGGTGVRVWAYRERCVPFYMVGARVIHVALRCGP